MKKQFLYLSLFLLISSLSLSAKQLTESEALEIAQGFTQNIKLKSIKANRNITLAYTDRDANAINFYAFNKGDNEGYILVSAEDGTDAILGYTDSGKFDYNNIPDNMKWWLSTYAEQIKEAKMVGASLAPATKESVKSVSPLIKSKWGQGSPYNNLCPTLSTGSHCATGCVATALAQIMYYYKWPVTGTGSKSYSDNGSTRSADFGNTTYQWDAMTPIYSSSSTVEANNAVATLMYHCGVASEMSYGSSSGAQTSTAVYGMLKFFGYDDGIHMLQRDYYGREEWETIIKSELDAGRPIMYGGYTADNAGHQFICDGYDTNNMFHINWGWSGMSDGYFKIAILTPNQQGTGGSTSGFSYGQDAVIGIQRPNEDSKYIPYSMYNDGFKTYTTASTKGSTVTYMASKVINSGYDEFNGTLGVGIVDMNTNDLKGVIYTQSNSFTLKINNYTTFSIKGIIPTNLEDGTYKLSVMTKATGSNDWMRCNSLFSAPTNYLTVEGNNVTFSQKANVSNLTVSNLTIDKAYKNIMFNAKCDITNSGEEYYSTFQIKILNKDTKKVLYTGAAVKEDILKGETASINFIEQISTINAGNYLFTIVDDAGNQLCTPIDFELGETPAAYSLKVLSLSFEDANKVPKDNFVLTAKLSNTGGLFYGPITVVIFPKNGGTSLLYFSQNQYIESTAGIDVVFNGAVDLDLGTYAVSLFEIKNGNYSQMAGSNWKQFTLVEGSGVISTIENQPSEVTIYPNPAESIVNIKANGKIDAVRVFDMSGRMLIDEPSTEQVDISDLSKGNYLMQIVVEGKAEMKTLIKK